MRAWPITFPPRLFGFLAIVLAVVGIPVTVWATFYRTTPEEAHVGQMRWERQVEVEMFKTIQDRDWRGQEPSDARVYDERREVHHYDRVPYSCTKTRTVTTYDSKGRSSSRTETYTDTCYRDEPVYRTRLYYEVDRWATERWLVTKGTEIAPHWAQTPETFVDVPVLGNERVGDERREHYEADVSCEICKESAKVELSWAEWPLYRPGQPVTAYVNSRGTVRGIKP